MEPVTNCCVLTARNANRVVDHSVALIKQLQLSALARRQLHFATDRNDTYTVHLITFWYSY